MKRMLILINLAMLFQLNSIAQVSGIDNVNKRDEHGNKTGKWISYSAETNKITSIEYFIDGKRNGKCTYYGINGRLLEEAEYVNDTLNGLSKSYLSVGGFEVGSFKDGQRHGITKLYNYKGKLVEEWEYVNGIRHGIHRTYYYSGKVQTEGNFVNGKETGTRRSFKDNAGKELILETDFVEDERIERRYYRKGKLIKVEKEAAPTI